MRGVLLPIALACAATVPLMTADGQSTCPPQPVHTYVLGLSTGVYSWTLQSATDGGAVIVADTNVSDCNRDGVPGDFDGDLETGVGGGFFGHGTWAATCGLNGHGPNVAVTDLVFGPTVAFIVGEDAPALGHEHPRKVDAAAFLWVNEYFGYPRSDADLPSGVCETNGLIAPQYDTGDCLSTVFHGTGVTCGSGGGDGGYWVFLLSPEVSEDGNTVWLGNPPTTGTIAAF